jgi:hypothetical protein
VIVLEIPRIPESPNQLRRFHWRHRHRHDNLWKEEVWYAVLITKPMGVPFAKAQITIDRRSHGQLDEDNLVSAMKPVIDALRHAQVIVDDTPAHIRLTVTQSRGIPRTRIEVHSLQV